MTFLIVDPIGTISQPADPATIADHKFVCRDHSSNCAVWCGAVTCSDFWCDDYLCGTGAVDATFD